MTSPLNKPVRRESNETVRDGSKTRALIITIYPDGLLGLRPKGTRREEFYPIEAVYSIAVKARVAAQRAEKNKIKKAKRGGKA